MSGLERHHEGCASLRFASLRFASLSAAILARPELHRDAVQQAQGAPAQGGGTHNSSPAANESAGLLAP
jgi:hypothetical protein